MNHNSNLKVEKFIFNEFDQNTYVIYDTSSFEAVIIDPGNSNAYENDELERFIKDNNLKLTRIFNTHGHIDHIFGVAFVKETFGSDFYFPSPDLPLLLNVRLQSEMIGIPAPVVVQPDYDVHQFELIKLKNFTIEVIKTPGHSPGGTCYLIREAKKIFTGDTIFYESIGRTDLWGGNQNELIKSIKNKIFTLEDDFEILPGHGPASTIYHEKNYNPFIKQE